MVLSGGLMGTHIASAAASLHLSRYIAAPNDNVTVIGSGFHAAGNVVVTAYFNVSGTTRQVSATSQTDGSGAFSARITVPGGTRAGASTVTAKDFHGDQASQKLLVLALAYFHPGGSVPTIYVMPTHRFYASGAGFKPNESIKITGGFPQYDGNTVQISRTVQADSHGNIPETLLRVPEDAKAGKVTMQAAGASSGKKAQVTVDVVYHPTLLLNSATVRPGQTLTITGVNFVPNSTVHVAVTFPRNGATTITESRDATTGGGGKFTTSITLPGDTAVGKYTVSAVDGVGNFRATTSVTVSIHPTITIKPVSVYAGGSTTVSGSGFGSSTHVSVQATFGLVGGGTRTMYAPTGTGSNGNFSTRLYVPGKAAAGTTTVYAKTANGQATAHLQVLRQKATATPTPTPTPTPRATPTPVPAATHHHHHHPQFGYRYVSVWYHVVRLGTNEHIQFMATLHTHLGIWVHVYFPGGGHYDYFQTTAGNGFWAKTFFVPWNAMGAHSNRVLITFRLWHGKKSVMYYKKFTLVR